MHKEHVLNRFLEYVKIDTQSDSSEESKFPSTDKQKKLLQLLKEQLCDMKVPYVKMDEKYGYVYAKIPSNVLEKKIASTAFLAHVDTSEEVSGAGVNPRVIKDYDGKDILLNEETKITTKVIEFPELKNYIGKKLVVTDGNTLLGADDKAGVAEIMEMVEYFMKHPDEEHGDIWICFTPDEETGRGVDHIDMNELKADYAYTVDGGPTGELSYENFNAAGASVHIKGKSVHPGDAKGVMINSMLVAMEFQSLLPNLEIPAATKGYEGFYHLCSISGNVDHTISEYIIRDHDREKFELRKRLFGKAADYLNEKYGPNTVTIDMKDSYYNMKEKIEPCMQLIEIAKEAMLENGVTPDIEPIRGGTDGARLSFMGLPCPNLGTGGHNYHGRHEYVCVESMEKNVEILKSIVLKMQSMSKKTEK